MNKLKGNLTIHQRINIRSGDKVSEYEYLRDEKSEDIPEDYLRRAGWLPGMFDSNTHNACLRCELQGFECECQPITYCKECNKLQRVIGSIDNWGYCGPIYGETLSCGHQIIDVSADICYA